MGDVTLYVGTYTKAAMRGADAGMAGNAEGLYGFAFDEEKGTMQRRWVEPMVNPSYVALDAQQARLYCVHELETCEGRPGGSVSAWAVAEDGSLRLLGRVATDASPCHVAAGGGMLYVANYGGGTLQAYALNENGMMAEGQRIAHSGSGPNVDRQEAPHVHSGYITPDGRHVTALDLGTDTLTTYVREGHALRAEPVRVAEAWPGDGPRISAYDARRNLLYVACELTGRIAAFACDEKGIPMRMLHAESILSDGPVKGASAADVHLSADGRFCYASARGEDSLSVFAISEDGALSRVQHLACGGRTPRAFALSPSGGWLLCGHQDSDTTAIFRVDKKTGTLTPHDVCASPSPVCLVFATR